MTASESTRKRGPPGRPFRLRKCSRLRGRAEYLRVFRTGGRSSRPGLAVHAAPNELGRNRLGISVGQRFGNAVARNRIRRLLKEAFRLEGRLENRSEERSGGASRAQGYDLVCVPYPELKGATLAVLRPLLAGLARSACGRTGRGKKRPGR
jgi:ribonuclease P protein component